MRIVKMRCMWSSSSCEKNEIFHFVNGIIIYIALTVPYASPADIFLLYDDPLQPWNCCIVSLRSPERGEGERRSIFED